MLKYLSIRSKGKLLSFVFLLFLSCFLSTAIAQVTIKEKIELNGLPENKINKGSSIIYKDEIPSGFIMPKSGMLQVYYAYLVHFDGPMPFYSTLDAYFFKDDSTRVDSLWRRFTDFINWQRYFQFCYPPSRLEWDYFTSNDPNEYLWDVDKVNVGDSVQFTYFSDWVATGDTFSYPVYYASEIWDDSALVGWDVILGNYDWCMGEYDNAIFISIGVRDLFNVSFDPEEISPCDTTDIIIKKVLKDGTLADFDTSQTFELGKLEGCEAGYLLAEGDTSAHFYNVHQPFKFIAADSIDGDSAMVKIRVGLIENTGNASPSLETIKSNSKSFNKAKINETINDAKDISEAILNRKIEHSHLKRTFRGSLEIKNKLKSLWKKNKIIERDDPSFSCFPENWWVEKLNMDAIAIVKEYSILLGETKYYQAKYEGELLDKLVIEEVPNPELNGGLGIDVWLNNPVTIVDGDKLGVYWEKEKPIYGTNPPATLPIGLIRIVGRYWNEEQIYKVKLTATNGTDETSVEIKVEKPSKIGNSYSTSVDVFGNTLNVDSLCIIWGGELGIPPHFIKGQMKSETSSCSPFYPTYVFEPYTTQFNILKDYTNRNNTFFVQNNQTTFDPPVPEHLNVKDFNYYTSPTSVWQIIEDHSDLVNLVSGCGQTKYGSRISTLNSTRENGILYFYGVYSFPQNKYDNFKLIEYKKYDVQNHNDREPQANNEARNLLVNFLKYEWDGGVKDGKKGLINIKAQTRMGASYGLLQMLYTTAKKEHNYPPNTVPEFLNEPDGTIYSKNRLKNFLSDLIKKENSNNWSLGLEGSFKQYVWPRWNPGYKKYPIKVLENAMLFKAISL